MRLPDIDQPGANAVDETVVDDVVRRCFGVEPREDRLGLFTGKSAPTTGEPDEDALFETYMQRHFPGTGK